MNAILAVILILMMSGCVPSGPYGYVEGQHWNTSSISNHNAGVGVFGFQSTKNSTLATPADIAESVANHKRKIRDQEELKAEEYRLEKIRQVKHDAKVAEINFKINDATTDQEYLKLYTELYEIQPKSRHTRISRLYYLNKSRFTAKEWKHIHAATFFIGMSADAARFSWGSPEHINKSVGSYGVHEQWVYSGGTYVYFQDGILTSWQESRYGGK